MDQSPKHVGQLCVDFKEVVHHVCFHPFILKHNFGRIAQQKEELSHFDASGILFEKPARESADFLPLSFVILLSTVGFRTSWIHSIAVFGTRFIIVWQQFIEHLRSFIPTGLRLCSGLGVIRRRVFMTSSINRFYMHSLFFLLPFPTRRWIGGSAILTPLWRYQQILCWGTSEKIIEGSVLTFDVFLEIREIVLHFGWVVGGPQDEGPGLIGWSEVHLQLLFRLFLRWVKLGSLCSAVKELTDNNSDSCTEWMDSRKASHK